MPGHGDLTGTDISNDLIRGQIIVIRHSVDDFLLRKPFFVLFDVQYVENESFLLDLKCFFLTIGRVFKPEGVIEGGTSTIKKAEVSKNE